MPNHNHRDNEQFKPHQAAANTEQPKKRPSSLSFPEPPVKRIHTAKNDDRTGTSNPAGPSSKPYAQDFQLCAQDVAPSPTKQEKKHSEEGIQSAQHNYPPVCDCKRVTAGWKAFVEDETLVALSEVLYYLGASKLGNYDVCVEHRIKLALKLQLQKIDDTLILLTRVETLWKHRDWEVLRQFVEMKCRQDWWRLGGKVLIDEKEVTKYIINCSLV